MNSIIKTRTRSAASLSDHKHNQVTIVCGDDDGLMQANKQAINTYFIIGEIISTFVKFVFEGDWPV